MWSVVSHTNIYICLHIACHGRLVIQATLCHNLKKIVTVQMRKGASKTVCDTASRTSASSWYSQDFQPIVASQTTVA